MITKHFDALHLGRAFSASVLSQMFSSSTGLLFGIYLVRVLSPLDYGVYGIGFAFCLFYASIGSALFLIQMVIYMPRKGLDDKKPFAASIFLAVTIYCGVSVLITALMVLASESHWPLLSKYKWFIVGVATASASYLLKEFFIRLAFSVEKERWAAEINSVVFASIIITLSICQFLQIPVSVEVAISIYAISNFAAMFYGVRRTKLIGFIRVSRLISDVREIVTSGVWATLMTIAAAVRGNSLTFVTAAVVGPIAVAKIGVARLFVSPVNLMFPVISQVLLPRFAHLLERKSRMVISLAFFSFVASSIVVVIYGIGITVCYDLITPFLLRGKYGSVEIFALTLLIICHTLILTLRNPIELVLQASSRFQFLAIVHGIVAAVTCIVMFVLLSRGGLWIGVLGFVVSEIALVLIMIIAKLLSRKSPLKSRERSVLG